MPITLTGRQGKTIIVEGSTIKLTKKGWLLGSKREKAILIGSITSVEVKKPGVMAGFIQFSIGGSIARDSSFKITGGTMDASKDENSVLFHGKASYEIALEIKEYVEHYREASG